MTKRYNSNETVSKVWGGLHPPTCNWVLCDFWFLSYTVWWCKEWYKVVIVILYKMTIQNARVITTITTCCYGSDDLCILFIFRMTVSETDVNRIGSKWSCKAKSTRIEKTFPRDEIRKKIEHLRFHKVPTLVYELRSSLSNLPACMIQIWQQFYLTAFDNVC